MDFAIVKSENILPNEIEGDLKIDVRTNDIAVTQDELEEFLEQVIEAFDMSVADDIDFPEIYSRQREFINSDDPTDKTRRIADAMRILKHFPEINSDSIQVDITDNNRLQVNFKLNSGTQFRREI